MRRIAMFLALLLLLPSSAHAGDDLLAPFLALLEDRPGWTAGEAAGESKSFLGFRAVVAKRSYVAKDEVIEVEIVAGDVTPLLFDKLEGKRAKPGPGEEYRPAELDGRPATYMTTPKKAGLFLRLSDEAGVVLAGEAGSFPAMEAMARTMDWRAIVAAARALD